MNQDQPTLTFVIDSMSCGGCVRAIQETLTAIDGVAEVEVHLPSKSVTVKGTFLDANELIQAITQHRHWCFARVVQRAKAKERLERLQCLA